MDKKLITDPKDIMLQRRIMHELNEKMAAIKELTIAVETANQICDDERLETDEGLAHVLEGIGIYCTYLYPNLFFAKLNKEQSPTSANGEPSLWFEC